MATQRKPSPVSVRTVGPFDLGRLSRLHKGCFEEAWSRSDLAHLLAMPGGFGLIAELRYGVVERMRVTPMSRTAMLLGRSLRDVVILLTQALIMTVLAIPFGLRIDAAGRRGAGGRPPLHARPAVAERHKRRPHRRRRWQARCGRQRSSIR